MRKFLVHIFCYFIITGLCMMLTIWMLSKKYWPQRIPVIKAGIIENSPKDISLILGSSYAFYGINSTLLDASCYNMAGTSQGYYEDYCLLKNIASKRVVRFVVLPLGYFSNHYTLSAVPEQGEAVKMFDYEAAFNVSYKHDLQYIRLKLLLPGLITAGAFKSTHEQFDKTGNLLLPCTGKTWRIANASKAFARHRQNAHFETRNPYLDSILNICRQKNIKLNIVVFPATKAYRELVTASGPGFDSFLASLDTSSKQGFKLLDCRNLILDNESVCFRDADHLSPCGRDSLSRFLAQIILK